MRGAFGGEGRLLKLAEGVRLRGEHFGGLLFDRRTGTTVEVDREAYALLAGIERRGVAREDAMPHDEGERAPRRRARLEVIEQLLDLGILVSASPADAAAAAGSAHVPRSDAPSPQDGALSAPETVHWAITYECPAGCADCYARRHRGRYVPELSTEDALHLVDRLAQWGVFQLAIGGGEPLARQDLPAIAAHARGCGLVVHLSTGQWRVPEPLLTALAEGAAALQIGLPPERLLRGGPEDLAALHALVGQARAAGLHVGANVMLSRTGLRAFPAILARVHDAGFEGVTLLRYKPPRSRERWVAEAPRQEDWQGFGADLPAILERHPGLSLRVDCALSFLQRRLPAEEARAAGIRGCVAGSRILAVAPDGTAYPCSQLVHPAFCAGSLASGEPAAVWASPLLARYRGFRQRGGYRAAPCGFCLARAHCGGCRAFAADGIGEDPGCPGPVLPPVALLGKYGRRWDVRRYVQEHGTITVAEYTQRYGIGPVRARRELEAAGLPGKLRDRLWKRKAAQEWYADDPIGDIQESIGFTSAGFPFASREEIAAWIEGDRDYPRWLIEETEEAYEAPSSRRRREQDEPGAVDEEDDFWDTELPAGPERTCADPRREPGPAIDA